MLETEDHSHAFGGGGLSAAVLFMFMHGENS